jgi:hypothetical protein
MPRYLGADEGSGDGGDDDDGMNIYDSSLRVKCQTCGVEGLAAVRQGSIEGLGSWSWLRMPSEWTTLLPVSDVLHGPDPTKSLGFRNGSIHCRCPKHGFWTTGPLPPFVEASIPPIEPSPTGPPRPPPVQTEVQLHNLHNYSITVDVLDAGDLEAVKEVALALFATILAGPMQADVSGPGDVRVSSLGDNLPSTTVVLRASILAGAQKPTLHRRYPVPLPVGAIWIVDIQDRGILGLGG